MVVWLAIRQKFTRSLVCQRCGANEKEAKLTRSHAPHSKLASFCLEKYWRKRQKIYTLCEFCRSNHFNLERKVLQSACLKLMELHENYINQ